MGKAQVFFLYSLLLADVASMCCTRTPANKPDAAKFANVIHVKVRPVLRDTIALPLVIPGKLAAAAEIKLGFKTWGIIRRINVEEGASVVRGARIAMLDTVEFAAFLNKALAGLEKASRYFTRTQRLFDDSVATLEQLQNARTAFHAAQSDSAVAAFNVEQAILKAPSAGKILKRLAEINEVIGPGMPVVIFASTEGTWTVNTSIPDRDLLIVSIGDRAIVRFDAIPRLEFSATLVRIAGAAHPVTGTFEIELALDTVHPGFRPGIIADVSLFPVRLRMFEFIPASALVEARGDTERY